MEKLGTQANKIWSFELWKHWNTHKKKRKKGQRVLFFSQFSAAKRINKKWPIKHEPFEKLKAVKHGKNQKDLTSFVLFLFLCISQLPYRFFLKKVKWLSWQLKFDPLSNKWSKTWKNPKGVDKFCSFSHFFVFLSSHIDQKTNGKVAIMATKIWP